MEFVHTLVRTQMAVSSVAVMQDTHSKQQIGLLVKVCIISCYIYLCMYFLIARIKLSQLTLTYSSLQRKED